MNAVRVHKLGGYQGIDIESNVPIPECGENEVLINVKAAGVNPIDAYNCDSLWDQELPFTPGYDAAGLVKQVGKSVKNFKAGDRVFGICGSRTGAFAEYAIFEKDRVFALSSKLTFSQGAAIGIPYFTAHRALFNRAKAVAGETVLVHGASGGVGTAAVQLAKAKKLVVFGTAGTDEGLEVVKAAGAQNVFNHNEKDYAEQITEATKDKAGVDIVLEMLANKNLVTDFNVVRRQGRIVVIGSRGEIKIDPWFFMSGECNVTGVTILSSTPAEFTAMAKELVPLFDGGSLKPIIDREFPLADTREAMRAMMEMHGHKGKIVLNLEL